MDGPDADLRCTWDGPQRTLLPEGCGVLETAWSYALARVARQEAGRRSALRARWQGNPVAIPLR